MQGCAIALGFTAASHLDTVLSKLDSVAKNDMVRKSSGILGFMKVSRLQCSQRSWVVTSLTSDNHVNTCFCAIFYSKVCKFFVAFYAQYLLSSYRKL
jgi:hypothetical protein